MDSAFSLDPIAVSEQRLCRAIDGGPQETAHLGAKPRKVLIRGVVGSSRAGGNSQNPQGIYFVSQCP